MGWKQPVIMIAATILISFLITLPFEDPLFGLFMALAFGGMATMTYFFVFLFEYLDKKSNNSKLKVDSKPVGVTIGWDFKPHLMFEDGTYLIKDSERILYPEYFPDDASWHINPETGEDMPIILTTKKSK